MNKAKPILYVATDNPKLERDQKLNKHIYSLIKNRRYSPKAVIYELVNGDINFDEKIKSYTTIYSAIKKGRYS